MIAHASYEGEIRVTNKDGFQYIVSLHPDWKCTCDDFEDFKLPTYMLESNHKIEVEAPQCFGPHILHCRIEEFLLLARP